MNAEEKEYIETKSLGNMRVVRVDMSLRMRQNSEAKQKEPIKRQNVKKEQLHQEENDDIYALLQQIQDKRDAIFMEREADLEHLVKRPIKIVKEDEQEERIPSFKRRFVQDIDSKKNPIQELQYEPQPIQTQTPLQPIEQEEFNWNAKEYWDPPERDVQPTGQAEEVIKQQPQEREAQPVNQREEVAERPFQEREVHVSNQREEVFNQSFQERKAYSTDQREDVFAQAFHEKEVQLTGQREETFEQPFQEREAQPISQREKAFEQPFHEDLREIESKAYEIEPERYESEVYPQPVQPKVDGPEEFNKEEYMNDLRSVVMDTEIQENVVQAQYVDKLQTVYESEQIQEIEQPRVNAEKNASESRKLIFYTVLILVVDIMLILMLHSKGTLFGPSDVDDLTRYLCVFLKYAVVVHLVVTLFTVYKDKKGKRVV